MDVVEEKKGDSGNKKKGGKLLARRAMREFGRTKVPQYTEALRKASNLDFLELVVDFDALMVPAEREMLKMFWDIEKIFFEPTVAALAAVAIDNMGKEHLTETLKTIRFTYDNDGASKEGRGVPSIGRTNRVLIINFAPASSLKFLSRRTEAIQRCLEMAQGENRTFTLDKKFNFTNGKSQRRKASVGEKLNKVKFFNVRNDRNLEQNINEYLSQASIGPIDFISAKHGGGMISVWYKGVHVDTNEDDQEGEDEAIEGAKNVKKPVLKVKLFSFAYPVRLMNGMGIHRKRLCEVEKNVNDWCRSYGPENIVLIEQDDHLLSIWYLEDDDADDGDSKRSEGNGEK
mmetsp:Transcript_7626/g.10469  ORF Transcript_7626/g.10469 Transcript_7626/m.10469 type:complete len:344 (+) Transcript_7626:105-1136(+)